MRVVGKLLGYLFLAALVAVLAYFVFGPYENSDLATDFDPALLDQGVDTYLAAQEARFDDITEGVEKQVIWATEADALSEWSVLYRPPRKKYVPCRTRSQRRWVPTWYLPG